jgi:hypothetical protein
LCRNRLDIAAPSRPPPSPPHGTNKMIWSVRGPSENKGASPKPLFFTEPHFPNSLDNGQRTSCVGERPGCRWSYSRPSSRHKGRKNTPTKATQELGMCVYFFEIF